MKGRGTWRKHREEFELQGQSEYFVNLALFNNDKISQLAFEVNDMANEIYNLLPEMGELNAKAKIERKQKINVIYPTLRLKYLRLVNVTRGTFKKMDDTSGKKTYMNLVYEALRYCRKSAATVNLRDFCENVFKYIQSLQVTGIFPITAGYQSESGEAALFRQ